MISASTRIRSEGGVEAVESALTVHEHALRMAKLGAFGPAALLLDRPLATTADLGDEGVRRLLVQLAKARARLQTVVQRRLEQLGLEERDPRDAAAMLSAMPVLHEHHHLTPAFLLRAVHLFVFLVAVPTLMLWRAGPWPVGFTLGLCAFVAIARRWGMSHVVLTPRWLSAERSVVSLVGVTHAELSNRHWGELPLSYQLTLLGPGVQRTVCIRHCSWKLRAALAKAGVPVRREYTWFGTSREDPAPPQVSGGRAGASPVVTSTTPSPWESPGSSATSAETRRWPRTPRRR